MDYNKHEPEEHDELPPFTSEVERDELTAPSQAATPMTPEDERARELCHKLTLIRGSIDMSDPDVTFDSEMYRTQREQVNAIVAAIRAAEMAKWNEVVEQLAAWHNGQCMAYEIALNALPPKPGAVRVAALGQAKCEHERAVYYLRSLKLPSSEKESKDG